MAGEITNGGLVAIRSNRSSATGSKREPARTSTLPTPLRAALSRVIRSARSLTSVATTTSLWSARCSAWTPQPVPRSSDRPTGSRIVSCASDVDAGLMPRTWSAPTRFGLPSRPGVRSLTTHRSTSPAAYGRRSRRATTSPAVCSRMPFDRQLLDQAGQRPLGGVHRRPGPAAGTAGPGSRAARRPAYAADPGTVSFRARASWACVPSSSATPSYVKPAAASASRRRAGRSGAVTPRP